MVKSADNKIQRIWIVIICIILLLLSVSLITYGKIDTIIPTGNVDIFDININCDCNNKVCPTCSSCNNNETETLPVVGVPETEIIGEVSEPEIEKDGLVEAEDQIDKFQNQPELRIFENPAYEMENKIAPGDENAYQFLIRNNNEFDIKYNISLIEENPYSVNLKYRLKLNQNYILGGENNWLSYDEIKTNLSDLMSFSYDNYTLEWKWVHSVTDTIAGSNNANYKLHIEIDAEAKEV